MNAARLMIVFVERLLFGTTQGVFHGFALAWLRQGFHRGNVLVAAKSIREITSEFSDCYLPGGWFIRQDFCLFPRL
jgi:hypothetical protein